MAGMKAVLIFSGLFLIFLSGCETGDYSPYSYDNEVTIYSENNETEFRELLIILRPYVNSGNEKRYVVCDSVLNVRITINTYLWGEFNSFEVDTAAITKEIYNGYYVSGSTVKYPVIAPYQTSVEILATAGDYSDLLNNYFTLEPGFYICKVESFEIKKSDGTRKLVIPNIVEAIEVEENSRSTFIGEFDILVN